MYALGGKNIFYTSYKLDLSIYQPFCQTLFGKPCVNPYFRAPKKTHNN